MFVVAESERCRDEFRLGFSAITAVPAMFPGVHRSCVLRWIGPTNGMDICTNYGMGWCLMVTTDPSSSSDALSKRVSLLLDSIPNRREHRAFASPPADMRFLPTICHLETISSTGTTSDSIPKLRSGMTDDTSPAGHRAVVQVNANRHDQDAQQNERWRNEGPRSPYGRQPEVRMQDVAQ